MGAAATPAAPTGLRPGAVTEDPVAVEVTGSWTTIENSSSGNQSQAITVPTDADICVVLLTGYLSGQTRLLSELSLSSVNASHFTHIATGYYNSTNPQTEAWYITKNDANWPGTGSQTLYWQPVSSPGEGYAIAVGFFKGVDTADPIGDSEVFDDSANDVNDHTSALTGVAAEDMGVQVCYSYYQTPIADPSGYGQTAAWENLFNSAGVGVAYEAGENALRCENLNYGHVITFAINAGGGGTPATVNAGTTSTSETSVSPTVSGAVSVSATATITAETSVAASATGEGFATAEPTVTAETSVSPTPSGAASVAASTTATLGVSVAPTVSGAANIAVGAGITEEISEVATATGAATVQAAATTTSETSVTPTVTAVSGTVASAGATVSEEISVSPSVSGAATVSAGVTTTESVSVSPSIGTGATVEAGATITEEVSPAPTVTAGTFVYAAATTTEETSVSPTLVYGAVLAAGVTVTEDVSLLPTTLVGQVWAETITGASEVTRAFSGASNVQRTITGESSLR